MKNSLQNVGGTVPDASEVVEADGPHEVPHPALIQPGCMGIGLWFRAYLRAKRGTGGTPDFEMSPIVSLRSRELGDG
jgi:hypothetical protein